MRRCLIWLVAAVIGFCQLGPTGVSAEQPDVHVWLDVSHAPDAGEYALKTSALLMEWYPRINDILYNSDHPLPFSEIHVVFEPVLVIKGAPAFARGNELHVNSEYIKRMPDDFRAMMIHELTHINQHYTLIRPDMSWVVEGIADYVRHKFYEKDIRPTLRLTSNAQLTGYAPIDPYFFGLQQSGVSLADRGYLRSYTIASTFLFWLEQRKDPQIVRHLNLSISQGQYSPDLFRQFCGQSLDDLWAAFVTESKPGQTVH